VDGANRISARDGGHNGDHEDDGKYDAMLNSQCKDTD